MEELLRFIASIRKASGTGLNPDTLLFKESILDSINILSLIGYVEEHIGRRLQDEEVTMTNFESARKITAAFLKGPQ